MVLLKMMTTAILLSVVILTLAVPDIAGDHSVEINPEPEAIMRCPQEDGVIYREPQDIGRPNRIAVIEIAGYGTVKFELYDNMTPITTENFVDLASTGFFDGISFHRCIDDFVAQTGDPNTKNNNPYDDGMGGSGSTIPLEICEQASHIDGAVGMARSSEPDSASSQFYFCDGPQHGLDDWERDGHGYAVFGVVIEGLEIVKDIAATETYGNKRPLLKDHPVDDIVMTRVYIVQPEPEDVGDDEDDGTNSKEENLSFPGSDILFIAILMILITRTGKKNRKIRHKYFG